MLGAHHLGLLITSNQGIYKQIRNAYKFVLRVRPMRLINFDNLS